jgi:hypothetical protein
MAYFNIDEGYLKPKDPKNPFELAWKHSGSGTARAERRQVVAGPTATDTPGPRCRGGLVCRPAEGRHPDQPAQPGSLGGAGRRGHLARRAHGSPDSGDPLTGREPRNGVCQLAGGPVSRDGPFRWWVLLMTWLFWAWAPAQPDVGAGDRARRRPVPRSSSRSGPLVGRHGRPHCWLSGLPGCPFERRHRYRVGVRALVLGSASAG